MKLFIFLIILLFVNPIFARPPVLSFDVKENEPAPISGKILSIPEWGYYQKTEKCCDELMDKEIVRLASEDQRRGKKRAKKPLIGDPWVFGGAIALGVALGVVIALEFGNKK